MRSHWRPSMCQSSLKDPTSGGQETRVECVNVGTWPDHLQTSICLSVSGNIAQGVSETGDTIGGDKGTGGTPTGNKILRTRSFGSDCSIRYSENPLVLGSAVCWETLCCTDCGVELNWLEAEARCCREVCLSVE